MKVEFTLEEARWLFAAAAGYGAVARSEIEKGGEWWVERAAREQDVARLWRKLKSFARRHADGAWQLGPDNANGEWSTNELALPDEERDGVFWLCLAALDPRSPNKSNVGTAEELVWPILRMIRRENAARKELKLSEARRYKYDDDPGPAAGDAAPHAAESRT